MTQTDSLSELQCPSSGMQKVLQFSPGRTGATVAGKLDAALEIRNRWVAMEKAVAKSNNDGLSAVRYVMDLSTVSLETQQKIKDQRHLSWNWF